MFYFVVSGGGEEEHDRKAPYGSVADSLGGYFYVADYRVLIFNHSNAVQLVCIVSLVNLV